MGYTAEQRKVIRKSRRTARRLKASPREEKSLYLAERVESNFRNLKHGDRDSVGALQQRPSQGWGSASEPVETDVTQYLKAAKKINRRGFKGSAGQLAQAVQRSAFPGRYDQHSAEGDRLARGVKGSAPNMREGSSTTTTSYRSTPGTDYSTERRDAKLAYLQDSHNPDALLNLGLTLKSLKDTPGTSSKVVKRSSSGSAFPVGQTGSALVDAVKAEADQINKAHVSYQWGGGHGAKQARGAKITPLDCSGAVSRVLGVDPRVSGEFAKWGKPGRGKVTVYSNSHHVLMEINGHFWGTSASNPGGGAGWIPRSKIPPGYLKNFTARHA